MAKPCTKEPRLGRSTLQNTVMEPKQTPGATGISKELAPEQEGQLPAQGPERPAGISRGAGGANFPKEVPRSCGGPRAGALLCLTRGAAVTYPSESHW